MNGLLKPENARNVLKQTKSITQKLNNKRSYFSTHTKTYIGTFPYSACRPLNYPTLLFLEIQKSLILAQARYFLNHKKKLINFYMFIMGSRIPLFWLSMGKVDRFIGIYSWLPGQNWLGFRLFIVILIINVILFVPFDFMTIV